MNSIVQMRNLSLEKQPVQDHRLQKREAYGWELGSAWPGDFCSWLVEEKTEIGARRRGLSGQIWCSRLGTLGISHFLSGSQFHLSKLRGGWDLMFQGSLPASKMRQYSTMEGLWSLGSNRPGWESQNPLSYPLLILSSLFNWPILINSELYFGLLCCARQISLRWTQGSHPGVYDLVGKRHDHFLPLRRGEPNNTYHVIAKLNNIEWKGMPHQVAWHLAMVVPLE